MPSHDTFAELCALAVGGQLSEEELDGLNVHLQACEECRGLFQEFEQTYVLLSGLESGDTPQLPEGMTHRFIARARSAGIPLPLQPNAPNRQLLFPGLFTSMRSASVARWAAMMTMVVVVAVALFLAVQYKAVHRIPAPAPASVSRNEPVGAAGYLNEENVRLRAKLHELQNQLALASGKVSQQHEMLESEKQQRQALTAEIKQLRQSYSDNESKQKGKMQEVETELESARARENAARISSLASEAEVKNLRDRVEKLSAQLSLANELDVTLKEAYDLIVDRNIHVLNVAPEAGEHARTSQPYGRIFYAEGKKLVFYAYDLAGTPKDKSEPTFYVWGLTPTDTEKFVSLGRFHLDNEQQRRWVLRVTDPRLLARINSVFVTEEPYEKSVAQPSGRRMLFRVLDARRKD